MTHKVGQSWRDHIRLLHYVRDFHIFQSCIIRTLYEYMHVFTLLVGITDKNTKR